MRPNDFLDYIRVGIFVFFSWRTNSILLTVWRKKCFFLEVFYWFKTLVRRELFFSGWNLALSKWIFKSKQRENPFKAFECVMVRFGYLGIPHIIISIHFCKCLLDNVTRKNIFLRQLGAVICIGALIPFEHSICTSRIYEIFQTTFSSGICLGKLFILFHIFMWILIEFN